MGNFSLGSYGCQNETWHNNVTIRWNDLQAYGQQMQSVGLLILGKRLFNPTLAGGLRDYLCTVPWGKRILYPDYALQMPEKKILFDQFYG